MLSVSICFLFFPFFFLLNFSFFISFLFLSFFSPFFLIRILVTQPSPSFYGEHQLISTDTDNTNDSSSAINSNANNNDDFTSINNAYSALQSVYSVDTVQEYEHISATSTASLPLATAGLHSSSGSSSSIGCTTSSSNSSSIGSSNGTSGGGMQGALIDWLDVALNEIAVNAHTYYLFNNGSSSCGNGSGQLELVCSMLVFVCQRVQMSRGGEEEGSSETQEEREGKRDGNRGEGRGGEDREGDKSREIKIRCTLLVAKARGICLSLLSHDCITATSR